MLISDVTCPYSYKLKKWFHLQPSGTIITEKKCIMMKFLKVLGKVNRMNGQVT